MLGMYLPQTVEYAMRAMAYLATLPPGAAVSAHVLSDKTAIPVAYLSKVLRKLVVADLLTSQKGHGGGFTLAYAPEQITFAEIFEAVDYGEDMERCVFSWDECDPENPCPLHSAWSVFKANFVEWANNTTLATATRGR